MRERIGQHRTAGLPFVVYRKPGSASLIAILQDSPEILGDPEDAFQGFMAQPFDPATRKRVWIRADRLYQCPVKGQRLLLEPASLPEDLAAKALHQTMVSRALDAIRDGRLHKVVLARRFSHPMPEDALLLFRSLQLTYPDAFCYYWEHPGFGAWMGASPELLLQYAENRIKTVSLAGTLPARGEAPPVFGEKEQVEQAMVTSHILEAMSEERLNPEVSTPKPVRAGGVWHLKTELAVKAGRDRALSLVRRMHPTPAVCGTPPETAFSFIGKHENFDREYYTGYLGAFGIEADDSFDLYVNLRCMQLWQEQAFVYVGGGITNASDPEAEWEETRQKSATLLTVLKNS